MRAARSADASVTVALNAPECGAHEDEGRDGVIVVDVVDVVDETAG